MFEVTTMLHIAICDDDAWMVSKVEELAFLVMPTPKNERIIDVYGSTVSME